MSKNDTSILRVTNEVSNLFMNSNMRHSQHSLNLVGSAAFVIDSVTYKTLDRFQFNRDGASNGGDFYGTSDAVSVGIIDSRFDTILEASKVLAVPATDGLTGRQRIESIFAKRLAAEGKMSFSKLMKIEGVTETVTIEFYYANAKDNFSAVTLFNSKVFTSGGNFPFNVWDELKIDNVNVPSQAANGVEIRVVVRGDGSAGATQYRTTGWQCNEGSRVLPWSLMLGDDLQEIDILQRYFEKSYDVDIDPGTAGALGRVQWSVLNYGVMNNNSFISEPFKTIKRVPPTIIGFSATLGTINRFSDEGGVDRVVSFSSIGTKHFGWKHADASSTTGMSYHYTAQAEL